MFYLVVSATLALAYGSVNAIIGLVLSVIAYAAVNAVLVRHAIRTGLSVSLFSRILLGRTGAAIATLIFFATAIYYAVFEGSVIALALQGYAGLGYPIAALIVVVYSVLLIFGSIQNWLDKLNGVLLPFYLIGLIAAVVLAIAEYGYSSAWLSLGPEGGAPATGWWDCFVAFMGVWILMMFTYDYARFGKARTITSASTSGAVLPGGVPAERPRRHLPGREPADRGRGQRGLGRAGADPADGAGRAGLRLDLADPDQHRELLPGRRQHGELCPDRLPGELPKVFWACVVGVICYVLMLADVFAYILQALAYQGIFVVAWVGLALVHILTEGAEGAAHDRVSFRLRDTRAVNPTGLTAWLVAAAAGLALHFAGGSLATFSAPVTFVVAAAVYAALGRRAAQPARAT